ncbi:MAG: formyltransferase family protein [Proteobacteria bacterium]|nr:formyltransferase family protein [Pseudomonadota bacterium]
MRVHLFTTDPSAFALIGQLHSNERVDAVVVPENRAGTEKVLAVRHEASRLGLQVYEHARGAALPDLLPDADAAISWLYSQIIAAPDLERYPVGMLNMHGGRIPEYRGAHVLQWQIINGERELGVTWHEIVEAVDAGAIWAESTVPIPEAATAADMREAMIEEGIRLFPEAWARAKDGGSPVRRPDLSTGCTWPQRKPSDGVIEPGLTARQLRDLVRALCPPWPSATVDYDGRIYYVDQVFEHATVDSVPYKTADGEILHLGATQAESAC